MAVAYSPSTNTVHVWCNVAAAGKLFPSSNRIDFAHAGGFGTAKVPPRNWWMYVGDNPEGALMAKWVGYNGRSSLNEWVGTELLYRWPHPTITAGDPYWQLSWRLVWNGVTNANAAYVCRLRFTYHESGTTWGTFNLQNGAWPFNMDGGATEFLTASLWSVVNVAQFKNGGSTTFQRIRRATWPENSDFHPYRTRP